MPDFYGDHRDTQRRWMHRPAPHKPEGYESRAFKHGEPHDTAHGWTHYPHDAAERSKAWPAGERIEWPLRAAEPEKPSAAPKSEAPAAEVPAPSIAEQLKGMRLPALRSLAASLGLPVDTAATAEGLRALILEAHNKAE